MVLMAWAECIYAGDVGYPVRRYDRLTRAVAIHGRWQRAEWAGHQKYVSQAGGAYARKHEPPAHGL